MLPPRIPSSTNCTYWIAPKPFAWPRYRTTATTNPMAATVAPILADLVRTMFCIICPRFSSAKLGGQGRSPGPPFSPAILWRLPLLRWEVHPGAVLNLDETKGLVGQTKVVLRSDVEDATRARPVGDVGLDVVADGRSSRGHVQAFLQAPHGLDNPQQTIIGVATKSTEAFGSLAGEGHVVLAVLEQQFLLRVVIGQPVGVHHLAAREDCPLGCLASRANHSGVAYSVAQDNRQVWRPFPGCHRDQGGPGRDGADDQRVAAAGYHAGDLRELGVRGLEAIRVRHLDAFLCHSCRGLCQAVLAIAIVAIDVADLVPAHALDIGCLPPARVEVLLRRLEAPLVGLGRLGVPDDGPGRGHRNVRNLGLLHQGHDRQTRAAPAAAGDRIYLILLYQPAGHRSGDFRVALVIVDDDLDGVDDAVRTGYAAGFLAVSPDHFCGIPLRHAQTRRGPSDAGEETKLVGRAYHRLGRRSRLRWGRRLRRRGCGRRCSWHRRPTTSPQERPPGK